MFSNPQIFNQDITCFLLTRFLCVQGTRYFSRGIDHSGNTSNYVETEQIILYDPPRGDGELPAKQVEGRIQMSYVQTRGSAPISWAQIANLKYTPELKIKDTSISVRVACFWWLLRLPIESSRSSRSFLHSVIL